MNKILILTSGKVSKLDNFRDLPAGSQVKVVLASFNDICYDSENNIVKVGETGLKEFSLIYFRMVGRSLEIATLVANYAIKNNIKLVDNMYTNSLLMPISLAKSIEMLQLSESGISIPRTVFGNFEKLDYPYVVKSTTGQKSREVWRVTNVEDLENLKVKLDAKKIYFAQALVTKARRIRALVVGDRVIGAIERQTKWNRDETKNTLNPIPQDIVDLALKSARAVDLDICGVDILVNTETGEKYVIEANAAPSWKLINKYCGVVVEDEIIKYIQTKI
jgi:glutathione synthase/RimK-type ligase-like ATP-grasp enzyme